MGAHQSHPGTGLSQVSGKQECVAVLWTQGHRLPRARGLGPAIASSSSGVSEGSPGGTVGLPKCIRLLQVARCRWVTGMQQAPAEQARECRWQRGLLAGDSAAAWRYEAGGPSRAALEQDKVTLACRPASNAGAETHLQGTGDRDRDAACKGPADGVPCSARERGVSPDTPSKKQGACRGPQGAFCLRDPLPPGARRVGRGPRLAPEGPLPAFPTSPALCVPGGRAV